MNTIGEIDTIAQTPGNVNCEAISRIISIRIQSLIIPIFIAKRFFQSSSHSFINYQENFKRSPPKFDLLKLFIERTTNTINALLLHAILSGKSGIVRKLGLTTVLHNEAKTVTFISLETAGWSIIYTD